MDLINASKNACSAGKTSELLRGGASGANRRYVLGGRRLVGPLKIDLLIESENNQKYTCTRWYNWAMMSSNMKKLLEESFVVLVNDWPLENTQDMWNFMKLAKSWRFNTSPINQSFLFPEYPLAKDFLTRESIWQEGSFLFIPLSVFRSHPHWAKPSRHPTKRPNMGASPPG